MNPLIEACAKGGQGAKALELFDSLGALGIKPDRYTFNSALIACGSEMRADKIDDLLRDMSVRRISMDEFTYSTAITSLTRYLFD